MNSLKNRCLTSSSTPSTRRSISDSAKTPIIDSKDTWDVLVGATADEDWVSHLCEVSEESPYGNTILHHLRTKFELSEFKRVGKTLIQQDILELLPDRSVEVVADLHLRPYYGEEYDSKEELYESLAKAGTTTCHGYATLYARVRNKRYTLAVRRLTDGDTASPILTELLALRNRFVVRTSRLT